jgi:hypothetical protein
MLRTICGGNREYFSTVKKWYRLLAVVEYNQGPSELSLKLLDIHEPPPPTHGFFQESKEDKRLAGDGTAA